MIAEGTSAEALELMNRRDLITGAASLFIGAEVLPSLAADSASKVLPDKTAFPIAGTYLNNAGFHPISLSCARAVKAAGKQSTAIAVITNFNCKDRSGISAPRR